MKFKKIILAVIMILLAIVTIRIAIQSYNHGRELKKNKQLKIQVYETFKAPYAQSDSLVGTTPKSNIGTKYSEVEKRRFGK